MIYLVPWNVAQASAYVGDLPRSIQAMPLFSTKDFEHHHLFATGSVTAMYQEKPW
jgi:hypothetical protein